MAPAYPKPGYRPSPGGISFQNPIPGGGFFKGIPKPANDNWLPGKPANDNWPKPGKLAKAGFLIGAGAAYRYFTIGKDLFDLSLKLYGVLEYNPYFDHSGWRPRFWPFCSNGKAPLFWQATAANSCLPNQAGDPATALNVFQPVKPNTIAYYAYQSCPPFPVAGSYEECLALDPTGNSDRFYINASYNRIVIPGHHTLPHASHAGYYLPKENPNQNPSVLPILQWVPLHKPLPYSQNAKNWHKLKAKLEWLSPTPYVPKTSDEPDFVPNPDNPLVQEPGAQVQVYPKIASLGGFHVNKPPPKGTKERKFILSPHQGSPIGLLVNFVTETDDFVTALYYALPKHLRAKGKVGLHTKAALVYKHFKQINVGAAINNLLQNQIGDTIGGIKGKANAQALKNFYGNSGFNFVTGKWNVPLPI